MAGLNGDDRVVVVTGGGGHLGRAIVGRLLRDGFCCVVADMNESVIDDLSSLGDERVVGVVCDVRSTGDRSRLVDYAASQSGSLFGLVNNAGIGRLRPLLDESVGEWRETFAVNLEAAFFLSQLTIDAMRQHGEGRIINVASMHGIIGGTGRRISSQFGERGPLKGSAYAASKGGLIQMTRDLASAVGQWNILVNSISPGQCPRTKDDSGSELGQTVAAEERDVPVGPRLGERLDAKSVEDLAAQIPLQRVGRPSEIAGPVSFLLSDDASYITGTNLVVDGGFTIW